MSEEIYNFKKRSKILLYFFAIWMTLIILCFLYFSVGNNKKYIEFRNKIAYKEQTTLSARGSILDKNRIPIAWSERKYDLYFKTSNKKDNIVKKVFNIIDILPKNAGSNLIKKNLLPSEIQNLKPLMQQSNFILIKPRLERKYVDLPNVRKLIGEVQRINNLTIGISGLEKEYDNILRGVNAKSVIMFDRSGKMLTKSMKVIQELKNGKDVILDKTINELNEEFTLAK